jgi:DNA-binding NtrC family response regulator
VAEDQEQVRTLTAEILRRQGYHVLEAVDGKTALELARNFKGPIHLFVSDVVMPETNTRELFEAVRVLRPDLKLLRMSGYAEETPLPAAEISGHFIQKPFLFQEFILKVREILDRG